MKHKQRVIIGASLVILSSFFYASYGIWTTLMGNFFGGYTASALRSVVVVAILTPVIILANKIEPLYWSKNWKYLLGMTGAALFIWGPLYYAVLTVGVGLALTINYASFVLGLFFFGWLLHKEKLTKTKWVSAAIGFAGLGIILLPGTENFMWLALAAAVLSGFATSLNISLTKKIPYGVLQTTIIVWVTSVIANILMAFVLREEIPTINFAVEWVYLVVFALASILATLALVKGLRLIASSTAGILGLTEIIFALLFGVLLFNEQLGFAALTGAVLILVAAAIANGNATADSLAN